jgi:hypothetical protein
MMSQGRSPGWWTWPRPGQDMHRDSRVDVECGQQRGIGLTGAVDGDPEDSRGDDAAVEAAAEVARLDRGTVPRGEDQAGIDPAVSRTLVVSVLLLLRILSAVTHSSGSGSGASEWVSHAL